MAALFFFCKFVVNPEDILPEGLYDGDIVLTQEQAYDIFSPYIKGNNSLKRFERKVTNQNKFLWNNMPIKYMIDVPFSKLRYIHII